MKTFIFTILFTASFLMLVAESDSLAALLVTKGIALLLVVITAKFYTANNRKDMKRLDKWMEE